MLAVNKPDSVPICFERSEISKLRTRHSSIERRRVRLRIKLRRTLNFASPRRLGGKIGGDNLSSPSITLGVKSLDKLGTIAALPALMTLSKGRDSALHPVRI